jgi:glycosyltransferase involved in cell wall biosynthesis
VVFNGGALLEPTITAIRELTYPDVEYIIIDGGSKDSTLDVINTHREGISRWISEPDKGIYDAMNKGLGLATGDYIWFLNAGDSPAQPDVLNRIFAKGGNCDYYYGDTCLKNDSGRSIKVAVAPTLLTFSAMLRGMQVSHQSILVKRRLAPLYELRYKYIADQKWIVDILRATVNGHHAGLTVSNYLLGGLSHQRYGRCVLEKMRYSFDELPWFHAAYLSIFDALKAIRFYVASILRRWGLL